MARKLLDLNWIDILALIGTILNFMAFVVAMYEKFFASEDGDIVQAILAFWLGVIFIITLALLVLTRYHHEKEVEKIRTEKEREARFARARDSFRKASEGLCNTWLSVIKDSADDRRIRSDLTACVRSIAEAYGIISGVTCRACVKEIVWPEGRTDSDFRMPVVTDLVRNTNPGRIPRVYNMDFVSDNTDFEELVRNPDQKWFFSNDLLSLTNYKNSHWTERVIKNHEYTYLATMVWPIRDPDAPVESPEPLVTGFLCVDSLETNAFDESLDYSAGAAYATQLYALLSTWSDLKDAPADECSSSGWNDIHE